MTSADAAARAERRRRGPWSERLLGAAALVIGLALALPVLTIIVLALHAHRERLAASDRHRAAGLCAAHAGADGGRGPHHLRDRHGRGLARHHVPLSLAAAVRLGLAAAARHAGLHRGLCLCRFPELCGPGADLAARRFSAGRRPPTTGSPKSARWAAPSSCCRWCSTLMSSSPRGRASSASRATQLEVARALGQTPWGAFRNVALPLARPGIAVGVSPGPDGVPERHRRRGLLRRAHADARRLHDLAGAGKSRRRGADLRRDAALHLRPGVVRAHGAAQAVLRAALPAPAPAGPHPPQRLAARAGGHRLRAADPHRLRRARAWC